jgi:hypothetical protein
MTNPLVTEAVILKRRLKTVFLIVLLGSLAACGGKKARDSADLAKEVSSSAGTQSDITRPPEVIKEVQNQEQETNPDETISFDEWRRRRQLEQQGLDQAVEGSDPDGDQGGDPQ